MRMNQRGGLTAAKVVNSYPAQTLTQLLGDWGELDTPWKVANCIVRARETAPIQTTAQLVEAVRPCTPKKDESKFLTKLFQALRIEVNGEMEALKMALEQSSGYCARATAGRHLLPLARRPAGKEFPAQRQFRGRGGKGFLRPRPHAVRNPHAQGGRPLGRRTGTQPPVALGEAARRRKTMTRPCIPTTNSTP